LTRDAQDTDFAGYPANLKAGYRIFGQISGGSRIQDTRPDIYHTFKCLLKYEINKDLGFFEDFLTSKQYR
jgi:hypothetical protein